MQSPLDRTLYETILSLIGDKPFVFLYADDESGDGSLVVHKIPPDKLQLVLQEAAQDFKPNARHVELSGSPCPQCNQMGLSKERPATCPYCGYHVL